MDRKDPASSLSYDKKHAEVYLAAALIAYREALNCAIDALAKSHGTADTTWLDELQDSAVRQSKGTITKQVPIEVEAGAMRFGFQSLEAEFKSIRSRLAKP